MRRDHANHPSAAGGPAEAPLTVEVSDGPATRVQPVGELDLATCELLEQRLLEVLRQEPEELILDLTRLEFMDVSGVRVLLRCSERAREQSTRLMLDLGSGQPRRVLELSAQLDGFQLFAPREGD
jgi:anti-anti-sigma factor